MAAKRSNRRTFKLFKFDQIFLEKYGCIAGVDEAGCGPLAGPVVAAAVILPKSCKLPHLNDSKQLSASQRETLYALIQRTALAIGVGIIESEEIDRINIRQADFAAMRMALNQLIVAPLHILVDGFHLPHWSGPQSRIVEGDAKSAHIAAASIIAKVTRDSLMHSWDRHYPDYGFKKHKGYSTPEHLSALDRFGPSPIHRRSYAPVRAVLRPLAALVSE